MLTDRRKSADSQSMEREWSEVNRKPVLLLRVGELRLAIDLAHVIEIMRPLPVEPMAGTPDFVSGLSIIRGAPAPVVSMPSLLATGGGTPSRFVLVRAGGRRVALAVHEVQGIFDLSSASPEDLPPLTQSA